MLLILSKIACSKYDFAILRQRSFSLHCALEEGVCSTAYGALCARACQGVHGDGEGVG